MTQTRRKPPPHAWKPGQSGNPAGRKPGEGPHAKFRRAISEHVPEIITTMVQAALQGDVAAARLLLERTVPPIKPAEQPAPLALPDGKLTDQGKAVLAAVAAGQLAPGQGAQLLAAIGALARVIEVDELERRVAALERSRDDGQTD